MRSHIQETSGTRPSKCLYSKTPFKAICLEDKLEESWHSGSTKQAAWKTILKCPSPVQMREIDLRQKSTSENQKSTSITTVIIMIHNYSNNSKYGKHV